MKKRNIYILILAVGLLLVGASLYYWLPNLFVDEFNYVYMVYANDDMAITTDPEDLFDKSVSRWTDVSITFQNNSQEQCGVIMKSETVDKAFDIPAGNEYGAIIPKAENIAISFCGVEKLIRVN